MASTFERISLVQSYYSAYNAKDWAALLECLHPASFQFSHMNRGSSCNSATEFVELIRASATSVVPDRHFGMMETIAAIGDVVVAQAVWTSGRPVASIEGRFELGVDVSLRIISMFVFEEAYIVELRDHN